MPTHGFLRVAAATTELRVADPAFNADRTAELLLTCERPRCGPGRVPRMRADRVHLRRPVPPQAVARRGAKTALAKLLDVPFTGVAVVGLPVLLDGMVFNAAAVLHGGKLLGVIPKTHLPNYKEFYDARYFAPACNAVDTSITPRRANGARSAPTCCSTASADYPGSCSGSKSAKTCGCRSRRVRARQSPGRRYSPT
ncbi:MAG: hypothetical protein QM749_16360 [Aquabacterium sp.]